MKFAQRTDALQPSATLAMAAKAQALRAQGVNVISFSTGEPDFDTPQIIKDSAKTSLDAGFTKYTPTGGIPELKAAIIEKLSRDNSLNYAPENILVTCGAKQAIFNTLFALINPGDEVIVPAPYWVSYPEQIKLCSGIPVTPETFEADNFLITAENLEKAISKKTKVFILCSPSNPTGGAYSKEQLIKLGQICAKHGVFVLADEIYEHLIYDGLKNYSIASLSPEFFANTITINGVSKAYAMTGWRMGFAAGPKELIAKMQALQDQQTSNITSFVQKACVTAFKEGGKFIPQMRDAFAKRRDLMLGLMREIPHVTCACPQGAFYLFPNFSAYLGKTTPHGQKISSMQQLAEFLLEKAHVATISGEPFGAPNYLRFSYATSEENIKEGLKRLQESLLQFS